jgi:protein arginine N-methyltransferase 1
MAMHLLIPVAPPVLTCPPPHILKSIITDAVAILKLDILTCTKEDLEFQVPFELTAMRNEYIHALVAYFEIGFTQIHRPLGISTSPMAKYTHWKQTIFFLPKFITICAGEKVSGEIGCQQNTKNKRDLDIDLSIEFTGKHDEHSEKLYYKLR